MGSIQPDSALTTSVSLTSQALPKVQTIDSLVRQHGYRLGEGTLAVLNVPMSLDDVSNVRGTIKEQTRPYRISTGLASDSKEIFYDDNHSLFGKDFKVAFPVHQQQSPYLNSLFLSKPHPLETLLLPAQNKLTLEQKQQQLLLKDALLGEAKKEAAGYEMGSPEYQRRFYESITHNVDEYNQHLSILREPGNPSHRLKVPYNQLSESQKTVYHNHSNAYHLRDVDELLYLKQNNLKAEYQENGWEKVGVDAVKDPAGYISTVSSMDSKKVSYYDASKSLYIADMLQQETPGLKEDKDYIKFQQDMRNQLWQKSVSQFEELEKGFDKIKSEQGFLGKTGDFAKNNIGRKGGWVIDSERGSDAVSEKFAKAQHARDELVALKTFKGSHSEFQKLYAEKMNNFSTALIETHTAVGDFDDSQKAWVDGLSDTAAGIAATGAVVATPFTGGGSLALLGTIGLGATASAVTKVGLKGADSLHGGRVYSAEAMLKDGLVSGVSGASGGGSMLLGQHLVKHSALKAAAPWVQRAAVNSLNGAATGASTGFTATAYQGAKDGETLEVILANSTSAGLTNGATGALLAPVLGEGFHHGGKGLVAANNGLNKFGDSALAKAEKLLQATDDFLRPRGPQLAFEVVGGDSLLQPKANLSFGSGQYKPLASLNNPFNPSQPVSMAMSGESSSGGANSKSVASKTTKSPVISETMEANLELYKSGQIDKSELLKRLTAEVGPENTAFIMRDLFLDISSITELQPDTFNPMHLKLSQDSLDGINAYKNGTWSQAETMEWLELEVGADRAKALLDHVDNMDYLVKEHGKRELTSRELFDWVSNDIGGDNARSLLPKSILDNLFDLPNTSANPLTTSNNPMSPYQTSPGPVTLFPTSNQPSIGVGGLVDDLLPDGQYSRSRPSQSPFAEQPATLKTVRPERWQRVSQRLDDYLPQLEGCKKDAYEYLQGAITKAELRHRLINHFLSTTLVDDNVMPALISILGGRTPRYGGQWGPAGRPMTTGMRN